MKPALVLKLRDRQGSHRPPDSRYGPRGGSHPPIGSTAATLGRHAMCEPLMRCSGTPLESNTMSTVPVEVVYGSRVVEGALVRLVAATPDGVDGAGADADSDDGDDATTRRSKRTRTMRTAATESVR